MARARNGSPSAPNGAAAAGSNGAAATSSGAHDGFGTTGRDGLSVAMLDASVDCVVAVDAGGRVVEWNPAAERTFGYPRSRALGADVTELIVPEAERDARRRELFELAVRPDAPPVGTRIERTLVRADGEEVQVESTLSRVEDPEPLLVAFIRDLSGQREERLEKATQLRRREAMTALGHQVLRDAPVEELGIAIAVLVREELDVDVCRIWQPCGDDQGPLELVASAGPADEQRHGPPPMPSADAGSAKLEDGVVFRVATPNGPACAIALHSDSRREPSSEDLNFLESNCQILVASMARHRSRTELKQAEARYRGLIERLPVVSYLAEYGPAGSWLYVSPQIEQLLGYEPEELLADKGLWWSIVHPDDRDLVEAEEERCARTLEPLSVEYRMVARDGRVVWILDEGALGRPADGGTVQVEGVLTDITVRRRAEEELRHRADHDELTGLANRRCFAEELRRRREGGQPRGTIAILDVDDLKFVNDSLGHAAGDSLLRSLASLLSSAMRPNEFVARFGGDEFTLLLEASTEATARRRLGALLRAVRKRPAPNAARASAGAVIFDADTTSTDEDLIVAADIALHESKERGGDRYSIFTGSGPERLAWVGQLRSAIDNDRLCLYQQPIFNVATGAWVAGEMLVRMLDDDGSVIPPASFLPTAERFGLIREIDTWVVERAIELAGPQRSVTINLSARSISDPNLTPRISSALSRHDVDPSRVVFELTETAAATASDELHEFGARIEQIGCALAIDDFGTGFGSLTYLKHLPVRYLKIDMEFVQGLCESIADRAIVESIVTIAKSLGMRTIAEGVEDEVTMEALRSVGVDFAQGYHLGRPAATALPA